MSRRVKFHRLSRKARGIGFGAAHAAYSARQEAVRVVTPCSWADRQAAKHDAVTPVLRAVQVLGLIAFFLACYFGGFSVQAFASVLGGAS